jgi:DNA-binding response OmpR family regulator
MNTIVKVSDFITPTTTRSKDNPEVNRNAPARVLVIHDDVDMMEMLRLILEPNAFEVLTSPYSPQAIEAVRSLNPDVVILDLSAADADGWEICRAIRSFSQVPILVLSAISKPGIVARALDEGADDYLLKPMTSSVLIAHLRRLIWRSRAESKPKPPP